MDDTNIVVQLISLLVGISIYVYLSLSLHIIANKTNQRNGWVAWIPYFNILLMCDIAGKPGWWLALALIPFVNIVIVVILWVEIAKARNKAGWLGILTIVPIVNFVVMGYLAFSK